LIFCVLTQPGSEPVSLGLRTAIPLCLRKQTYRAGVATLQLARYNPLAQNSLAHLGLSQLTL
jgi:hypothetical protein